MNYRIPFSLLFGEVPRRPERVIGQDIRVHQGLALLLGSVHRAKATHAAPTLPAKSKKPVRLRIVDDAPQAPVEPQPIPQPIVASPLRSKLADPTPVPLETARKIKANQRRRRKSQLPPVARQARRAANRRPESLGSEAPTAATAKSITKPKTVEPTSAVTSKPSKKPATDKTNTAKTNAAKTTPDKITIDDVYPATFQDVTPGESTLPQVWKAFGKPVKESKGRATTTYAYKVDSFPQVLVTIKDETVVSLQIQLEEPTPLQEVVEELELTRFSPVLVTDDNGKPLGKLYPERGVTLRFATSGKTRNVATILLEKTSAEHFLTRVQNDRQHRYKQNMIDLRLAQELAPNDARPHWLRAKILAVQGRPSEATTAVNEAVRLTHSRRVIS